MQHDVAALGQKAAGSQLVDEPPIDRGLVREDKGRFMAISERFAHFRRMVSTR